MIEALLDWLSEGRTISRLYRQGNRLTWAQSGAADWPFIQLRLNRSARTARAGRLKEILLSSYSWRCTS